MKIIVSGLLGHMGREVLALAENGVRGAEAVGGVDPMYAGGECPVPCVQSFDEAASHPTLGSLYRGADCIVDFSRHDGVGPMLRYACACGMPVVVATTGHTEEERAMIEDAAKQMVEREPKPAEPSPPEDPPELAKMKRMVNCMKRELADYLAGGGTAGDYMRLCDERLATERGLVESYRRDFERLQKKAGEIEEAWERKNAELRSMGLPTLPLPEDDEK